MDDAAIELAIKEHRFQDARVGLLQVREYHGKSARNTLMLAENALKLGDGYSAERYLTDLEQDEGRTARWALLSAHARILQGQPRIAEEIVNGVEAPEPEDGTFEWIRVWAAMEQDRIEEAEEIVDKALRKFPDSALLHGKGAQLSILRGNWDAADRHIADALANDPENYEALLLRGESFIARGDTENALESYREVVRLFPEFAVPKANVVGLLLDLQQPDLAESELKKAFEDHPQFVLLRFNQARLQAIRKRWSDARDTMQGIPSDWKKTHPASILLEAEIEAGLGNEAMARTLYAKLEKSPDFQERVRELLAELDSK